jgi:FkbM family methyltransferase
MAIYKQEFNGKEFEIIEGSTHPAYSIETFSADEKEFRLKYWDIKESDVVFDIGASYGAYAISACVMGASVYAFEPEPSVYCGLVDNVNHNNLNKSCYTSNVGMWSSKDVVDMKEYAPHWPPQTITGKYNVNTLDQFVEEFKITKIDWIKIDVEGAEEHVIKGGLNTIKKFQPNLIVECHTFLDKDLLKNVKKTLESLYNYDFEVVKRDPCVMLVARKKNK